MLNLFGSYSPVGLKEAALDSPTFRATTLHFCDQIEFIEKWLDGYARAATKLTSELAALESVVSSFLSYSTHPLVVSEAVVDHDYTLLAMRRCGEGSKDLWNGLISSTKKMENLIAEPIRAFVQEDLRQFKVFAGSLCLPGCVWSCLTWFRKPAALSSIPKNNTITCKLDTRRSRRPKKHPLSGRKRFSSTKPARLT